MDLVMAIFFLTLYLYVKTSIKECKHKETNEKLSENEILINDTSVLKNEDSLNVKCEINSDLNNQDTLTNDRKPSSIIDAQKKNLETASQQWKKRVEPSDAVNYSVAGLMHQDDKLEVSVLNFTHEDKRKKTPKANRFRGKDGEFLNLGCKFQNMLIIFI